MQFQTHLIFKPSTLCNLGTNKIKYLPALQNLRRLYLYIKRIVVFFLLHIKTLILITFPHNIKVAVFKEMPICVCVPFFHCISKCHTLHQILYVHMMLSLSVYRPLCMYTGRI